MKRPLLYKKINTLMLSKHFDKNVRKCKREYQSKQRNTVLSIQKSNPKSFWHTIKKISINSNNKIDKIPWEITINNEIITDQFSVLELALTIYMTAQNRKLLNKDTFICFIDLKKAFDGVDRKLLWYKLQCYGINGTLLNNIMALYKQVQYSIEINEYQTDWFEVRRGVKQGCILSPILFNIFINDIIPFIKQINTGIHNTEEVLICILLYADDIALLAEKEEDLQSLIDKVNA